MIQPAEPSIGNLRIGVVLNAFKRPALMPRQLDAVRNQTIPPHEIVIWHNKADGYDLPPLDLRPNESVITSSTNRGVWARYSIAQFIDADVYAIFDDDSIPAHGWFANALSCLQSLPTYSIVGSCGVLFVDGSRENRAYLGWKHPVSEMVHADILGHATMFGRDLARQFVPCFNWGVTCGEDYSICALARKLGGHVVCPPHDPHDRSGWGSIDGMALGTDEHALWTRPGEEDRKAAVHRDLRAMGWKCATEIFDAQ